jgi:carboxyl-terminal processing protease
MLKGASAALAPLMDVETQRLIDRLGELGIDWRPAPGKEAGVPKVEATLRVGSPDGKIDPGRTTAVTMTVVNHGTAPIHRLRAVTKAETFDGREFIFGRVAPGETRSFTVDARPSLAMHALTDEVTWLWIADDGPTPPPTVGRLEIRDVPRPRFGFSWHVIDDGTGESRGNGDGIVQAGEEIELLVRVKNIGDGPTSDLWISRNGGKDVDAEDEGVPAARPRKGAQVILRNADDTASLFLVKGSEQFSLEPGGEWTGRLRFRLNPDAEAGAAKAELTVIDDRFWSIVTTKIDLPVQTGVDALTATRKVMRPKGGAVVLRAAASDSAAIVATAREPFQVDGKVGGWFRVPLQAGGNGFVLASGLSGAGRNDQPLPIDAGFAYAPPVVMLEAGAGDHVAVGDKLRIRGTIRDDGVVKDVSVYMRGPDPDPWRKVAWIPLGKAGEAALDVEVPLQDGANTVEIVARDDALLQGSTSFGLYRQRATAARAGEAEAVVR